VSHRRGRHRQRSWPGKLNGPGFARNPVLRRRRPVPSPRKSVLAIHRAPPAAASRDVSWRAPDRMHELSPRGPASRVTFPPSTARTSTAAPSRRPRWRLAPPGGHWSFQRPNPLPDPCRSRRKRGGGALKAQRPSAAPTPEIVERCLQQAAPLGRGSRTGCRARANLSLSGGHQAAPCCIGRAAGGQSRRAAHGPSRPAASRPHRHRQGSKSSSHELQGRGNNTIRSLGDPQPPARAGAPPPDFHRLLSTWASWWSTGTTRAEIFTNPKVPRTEDYVHPESSGNGAWPRPYRQDLRGPSSSPCANRLLVMGGKVEAAIGAARACGRWW